MPLAATGSPKPYSHTPGGRIATSTQTAGGASYPFSYEYYLDGSQKSVTYPSGRKISYPDPDLAGRVTKVEGLLAGAPKSYVSSMGYNEHGLLASLALGYGYDVRQPVYNPHRSVYGQGSGCGDWLRLLRGAVHVGGAGAVYECGYAVRRSERC